jgi:hypothetical protein
MAKRKIDMQIALQGGDDVAKQFAELGRAGEKAFAQVNAAANNVQINNVSVSINNVVAKFKEVGNAGQEAFQKVGGAVNQASQQVNQQTSFFSTLTGRITILAGSITALVAGYLAAAKAASETVVALGRQADAAKLSISEFQLLRGTLTQLNLTEAEATKVIETLGKSLKDAAKEGQAAFERFGVRLAPANKQIQQFNQELEATGSKVRIVDPALASSAKSMQVLAQMGGTATASLSETARTLLKLGVVFDPTTGKIREGREALFAFADAIRFAADQEKAAQLVNKLYGEDIGRILVPAIREGNDAFFEAFKSIERLNLSLTPVQRKIGQEMVNAMTRLKLATAQARTEFGLAFAPFFTPAINAFADAIRRNSGALNQFAAEIASTVGPALDRLLKFFTQKLETPGGLESIKDAFVAIGRTVVQVFNGIIVPAFNAVREMAIAAAATINRAFGTKLEPLLVAIGAAITLLIGPFNALAIAVAAAFGGKGPSFDAFRDKLKAIGIDLDAIATKVSEVFSNIINDLKALFEGRDTDVQNTVLVQLKDAIIEFGTSAPGIILEVAAALLILRKAFGGVAVVLSKVFGREFTTGGVAAIAIIGSMTGAFNTLAAILGVVFLSLGSILTIIKIIGVLFAGVVAVFAGGPAAIGIIIAALALLAVTIFTKFNEIKAAAAAAWAFIVSSAQQAWHNIQVLFSPEGLAIVWEAVKTAAADAWKAVVAIAEEAWTLIVASASGFVSRISSVLAGLIDAIVSPFRTAAGIIAGIWNGIIDLIQRALNLSREVRPPGRGGGATGEFETGGYTGNVGTRQIAGFVHGGEYVQPARVVRQPGVLAFMETLRRVGDLNEAIRLFTRGFSIGGLVDNFSSRLASLAIPQFASGGFVPQLVPAGTSRLPDFGTVTLDFGRGQRVRGIADRQIVEALRRIAIQDQTLSAGREIS